MAEATVLWPNRWRRQLKCEVLLPPDRHLKIHPSDKIVHLLVDRRAARNTLTITT
jgi:hypothetical protein